MRNRTAKIIEKLDDRLAFHIALKHKMRDAIAIRQTNRIRIGKRGKEKRMAAQHLDKKAVAA